MIERRIKGRVVGIDNMEPDVVYFILEPEEDKRNKRKKKRRVTIPIHREWSDVLALLDAAFLKDYVVSIEGLYEERDAFVFVTSKKGIKVEDDQ